MSPICSATKSAPSTSKSWSIQWLTLADIYTLENRPTRGWYLHIRSLTDEPFMDAQEHVNLEPVKPAGFRFQIIVDDNSPTIDGATKPSSARRAVSFLVSAKEGAKNHNRLSIRGIKEALASKNNSFRSAINWLTVSSCTECRAQSASRR